MKKQLSKAEMDNREAIARKIENIEIETQKILKDFKITTKDLHPENGYSKYFYNREDIPEEIKNKIKEKMDEISQF